MSAEQQAKRFSDSKLEVELAFARSFASAPPVRPEERRWLEVLEAEAKRRTASQP